MTSEDPHRLAELDSQAVMDPELSVASVPKGGCSREMFCLRNSIERTFGLHYAQLKHDTLEGALCTLL